MDHSDVYQGSLFSGVDGEKSVAMPSGRSSFRFLLPMDKVMADSEIKKLYEDGRTGMRVNLDFKDDIVFVNYGCRSNTLLNCAVPHNTRKDQDESDTWNSQSSLSQLKETTHNFHPTLQRYFDLCEDKDIKIHHMMIRSPLKSFVHGRACVIGDAAHVMLPTHGAGAGVTIESAATLEPLLTGVEAGDFDEIKQRLRIWDKLRNGRCNFVMLMSNAGVGGLNIPGVAEKIRKYYEGPLPPKDALTWSEKSRAVFFDCDPYEDGTKALEKRAI